MDYSKEGPRIFVQYQYDKITIENVNEVCKTFRKGCRYDILASEMGPSCSRDDQFSHLEKVYIRFKNFKVSLDDLPSISSRYVSLITNYNQSQSIFQNLFPSINKIFIFAGGLGYHPIMFRHLPNISLFSNILSLKFFGNS